MSYTIDTVENILKLLSKKKECVQKELEIYEHVKYKYSKRDKYINEEYMTIENELLKKKNELLEIENNEWKLENEKLNNMVDQKEQSIQYIVSQTQKLKKIINKLQEKKE